MTVSSSLRWKDLENHVQNTDFQLKHLLKDESRLNETLIDIDSNIYMDFSRELLTVETMKKLEALAKETNVLDKIEAMFRGDTVNVTENRAARHVALRASPAIPEVAGVKAQIREFSEKVRSGEYVGATGKKFKTVLCIGIGGSYLGPEFVYEALRTQYPQDERQLRFLANVDPIDVARSLVNVNLETTLVVIISKTFTTAETMLNAKSVKSAFESKFGREEANKHFAAVSTALDRTSNFGIPPARVFAFWDWVGGRYSVTSAVGLLPLSIQFGFDVCEEFLRGARDVDNHFLSEKSVWKNIPLTMGLIAVWNASFLKIASTAILPYSQALCRFVAHVQQVDMESNGKSVTLLSENVDFRTGPVIFGEPGTNGQHSFYQLIHQGSQIVACEFIGFKRSQGSDKVNDTAHDELMSNFFAQPDALALGFDDTDHPEKNFSGNRPSLSLLLPVCDAYFVGSLLAIYEHRTVVQSFTWNINAFDQYGVELGKLLAKNVREFLSKGAGLESFPEPTQKLLKIYKNK
jgi:glucose-6-phosphate isomerase